MLHVDSNNFRDALAYTIANDLSEKVLTQVVKTLSFDRKDLQNPFYINNLIMSCMGDVVEGHMNQNIEDFNRYEDGDI